MVLSNSRLRSSSALTTRSVLVDGGRDRLARNAFENYRARCFVARIDRVPAPASSNVSRTVSLPFCRKYRAIWVSFGRGPLVRARYGFHFVRRAPRIAPKVKRTFSVLRFPELELGGPERPWRRSIDRHEPRFSRVSECFSAFRSTRPGSRPIAIINATVGNVAAITRRAVVPIRLEETRRK